MAMPNMSSDGLRLSGPKPRHATRRLRALARQPTAPRTAVHGRTSPDARKDRFGGYADRRSEVRIGEVCLGEPRPCEVRLWSLAPERFAPERSAPWRLARCASKPGTVWYGLRAVKRGGTAIREPPYSIVMTVTVVTLLIYAV